MNSFLPSRISLYDADTTSMEEVKWFSFPAMLVSFLPAVQRRKETSHKDGLNFINYKEKSPNSRPHSLELRYFTYETLGTADVFQ
ncbi:hypothetical protein NPIL_302361 [Nephila pilipes]|uniref:Uncharacterized protein n=1 Tax=Nephila pilipes TaxID=299642 RepID=A0A8X6QAD7_NEPPI|nr:hypothetical protein NPIL_302361 [Nephila pilipes]